MSPAHKLSPDEFDFSNCPDKEKPACYRYEYCRHSLPMRKAIGKLRQIHPDVQAFVESVRNFNTERLRRETGEAPATVLEQAVCVGDLVIAMYWEFFGCIDQFPEKPWLGLDPKVRTRYLTVYDECQQPLEFGFGVRIWFESGLAVGQRMEIRKRMHPDATIGWFSFPAGRLTTAQILDQFKRQLHWMQQRDSTMFARSGGRGGPEDHLRRLGALRLLQNLSPAMARRRFNPANGAPYQADPNWYKARDAAKAEVESFNRTGEKIIELIDDLSSVLRKAADLSGRNIFHSR